MRILRTERFASVFCQSQLRPLLTRMTACGMHLILGINFGGSFTDIMALDTSLRRVFSTRILTTSQASNRAVAEAPRG
jgi:hypothetical protein